MNQLSKETSPYLLQHANNPIDWHAWNEASLLISKETNKLIIVSTGYSACHWCHVMAHESFEDLEVAATMNAHFISIKVDREERPDIDAIYMKAVQLMSGQGGWPMNVVCLPDGRPIWGGTYFRKNEWINSLEHLAELYKTNPEKVIDYAEKLHEGIRNLNLIPSKTNDAELSQDLLKPLVVKWIRSFDTEFGGYGRAPKFMMPNNLKFLLRYGWQNQNQEVLDHVHLTLTKMACGGLFDTVGGGFSRYSVDLKWHVPHFEKMLYDNGQLVSVYSDAYKLTGNPLYKEVIEKTLSFVESELTNTEGGFFSAWDADSLDQNGHLEEGAFYVWQKIELQQLLGNDYDLFSAVFNINDFGHWENGNYVLIQNKSIAEVAAAHNLEPALLQEKKIGWEKILFAAREARSRPRLDDKSLTSWNALMLKGYVDAYKALQKNEYLEAAVKNAKFIVDACWTSEGNLFHTYKNGTTTINGYLEDYALVTESLIALYEATFDEKYLIDAKQLTDYCIEHFFDADAGYFRFTSDLDAPLIASHFEMEDNVISASNSVMADNLFRLGIYFNNQHYDETFRAMVSRIIPLVDYPSAFANWLSVFMHFSQDNRELAMCGDNALSYCKEVSGKYLPNTIIAGSAKPSILPFLENRFAENEMLFYVCQNRTCQLPSSDFNATLNEIQPQAK